MNNVRKALDVKVDIENEKVDIQDLKVDIESVLSEKGSDSSAKTTVHIHRLFEKFVQTVCIKSK